MYYSLSLSSQIAGALWVMFPFPHFLSNVMSGRHLMITCRGHLKAEFSFLSIKLYKNILLSLNFRINIHVPVLLFCVLPVMYS